VKPKKIAMCKCTVITLVRYYLFIDNTVNNGVMILAFLSQQHHFYSDVREYDQLILML
jgi:hypothetical protein